MEQQNLGRTELSVSKLALGCLTFGPGRGLMHGISTPEAEARVILDHATGSGINLLDVADVYQDGISEQIVGRWIADRGRRSELVLATKVGGPTGEGQQGLSRLHLMEACEASLRRLRTDYIDLYQVHWPDARTPLQETLGALDELRRAGKIRFAGCSNFPAWLLARSLWIAEREGLLRFESLQNQYSLALRHIEREIVPLCLDRRVGLLVWGSLACGLLGGSHDAETLPAGHQRLQLWLARYTDPAQPRRIWGVVDAVREVAQNRGCPPAVVAMAWILNRPAVTSCITGVRTLQQLEQNLAAAELQLTAEEQGLLDSASAPPPDYPGDMMNRLLAGGDFWD